MKPNPFNPELVVIGSSSRGNSYAITCLRETLLLEAGVQLERVRRLVGLGDVVGCLITHRHGDHSKYVTDFSRRIKVGTHNDVIDKYSLKRAVALAQGHTYRFGSFSVSPFLVPHINNDLSVCPAYAYYISHPELGNILFATDAYMLPYKVPGINHFIIEANYDDELLQTAVRMRETTKAQYERIVLSHMSIDSCVETLRQCGTKDAQDITLVHLSSRHADPDAFKSRVQAATGVPTYIARPELRVTYSHAPLSR